MVYILSQNIYNVKYLEVGVNCNSFCIKIHDVKGVSSVSFVLLTVDTLSKHGFSTIMP